MFERLHKNNILKHLIPGKAVVLVGARRVGKTYLMNELKKSLNDASILTVHGDDLDQAEILSSRRLNILASFVSGYKYIFIDEAQMIPNIGLSVKLIVDQIPDVSVFMTGSSAIDIKNKSGEPLVGRGFWFNLYPLSLAELNEDYLQQKTNLENKLIYGTYPQVYTTIDVKEKRRLLEDIRNAYLLKDLLMLDNAKDSLFVNSLLKLIAFQVGNDVSYTELSNSLGVSKNTVVRYLDLLEKSYVLFSLRGFSRNLRKEISKSPRYYFWDNGIRNVIISNFNNTNTRDDVGKLWENFFIAERMKHNHYTGRNCQYYFWRTYDGKEIDLVEEFDGKLTGFECKWSEKKTKIPREFLETYINSEIHIVNPENYREFLL
jgi:predicted AAA+ superfamily ATPase